MDGLKSWSIDYSKMLLKNMISKYCKIFFERNRNVSNNADRSRAESGRFPLQIIFIKQFLKCYLYRNKKDTSSIAKTGPSFMVGNWHKFSKILQ